MSSPSHCSGRLAKPVALAVGLVLGLLAGCGRQAAGGEPAGSAAAPTISQATPGAAAEPAPGAMPISTGLPVVTLAWWTAPDFAPAPEGEAGRLLAGHIAAFEQANPSLATQVTVKAAHGKGGLLDFLLTAQKAAPTLLPDVVLLDVDDLPAAMRAGLLQPLDGLLSSEATADLYPFASNAGYYNGKLYAVQVEADIEHVAVDGNRLKSPPRTWAALHEGNYVYAFPTGQQDNPSDALLIQYIAAGGQVGGRDAPFVLDEAALFGVLDTYAEGRRGGVIPAAVLSLDDPDASYSLLAAGQADVANVRASRYLAERARLPNLGFGGIPNQDGTPATISHGKALALITSDPERQAAAARLIETLLESGFNSAWAKAANRLPTRRSALDLWDQDDPYVSFLRWQLEAAVNHPSGPGYLEAAPILAQAQRDVLSGALSAQEATERASGVSLP